MKRKTLLLITVGVVMVAPSAFSGDIYKSVQQNENTTLHYDRNGSYVGTSTTTGNTTYHQMNSGTSQATTTRSVQTGNGTTLHYDSNGSYKGTTVQSGNSTNHDKNNN